MDKEIMETLDAADRWSYNPFKKEIVCYWWKSIDSEGTIYRAKTWLKRFRYSEFKEIRVKYNKGYRPMWFLNEWQWEKGCPLEEI